MFAACQAMLNLKQMMSSVLITILCKMLFNLIYDVAYNMTNDMGCTVYSVFESLWTSPVKLSLKGRTLHNEHQLKSKVSSNFFSN